MRELVVAVWQTGAASVISLGLGLVATKIFAVVLGPAGIGFISLVRQTYQSAVVFATLNGQTALAQGIASREGETREQYITTAFWILLATGGVVALAFLALPSQISAVVMGRVVGSAVGVMRWLAFAVVGGVVSTYLAGVFNGHRDIPRLALLQTAGAVVSTLLAYPVALLVKAGDTAALALYVTLPLVVACAIAMGFASVRMWLPRLKPVFRVSAAKEFLGLSGALLLSGFLAAAIPLVVRSLAVRRFGLHGVGIFDVAWNISMNYLLFALASFSTYYVPSLSRLRVSHDQHVLVQRVLRLSMVLTVPVIVAATVLKPAVVDVLYAPGFLPSLDIMRWMFIGDYFKVTSWVFSFTMLAYADVRTLLWTEVVWGGLSIGGAAFALLRLKSLEAVGANFALVYGTYLVFTLAYVIRRRYFVLDRSTARTWLMGFLLILAAGLQTWSDRSTRPVTMAYVFAAIGFSWIALTTAERRSTLDHVGRVFRRQPMPASERRAVG